MARAFFGEVHPESQYAIFGTLLYGVAACRRMPLQMIFAQQTALALAGPVANDNWRA